MAGLFKSFYMGGFECATHRRRDCTQLDVIRHTRHDARAFEDYSLLQESGVRTIRDGLRWHLIEKTPGTYDWSSFVPMLEASLAAGTQVIWDLCHWGVPDGLDIFSDDFVTRFAAFSGAAAEVIRARSSAVPFYCAVNEISFWAWVGGDVETFHPHRTGSGDALKKQLVKASLAAMRAVRAIDSRARFVQAEPIINIVPDAEVNEPAAVVDAAQAYRVAVSGVGHDARGYGGGVGWVAGDAGSHRGSTITGITNGFMEGRRLRSGILTISRCMSCCGSFGIVTGDRY